MTTDNALNFPPGRRPTGRAPYLRIAAIVAGLAIALVVILVIVRMVFPQPDRREAMRGADRAGGASAEITAPPAVSPATEAQASADLQALQRVANTPALGVVPVQVSVGSPPVGAAPKGDGVTAASADVGPAG